MRIPIILSLGLLFASSAIATSTFSYTDRAGDEALQGFDLGLGPSFTCHDAAMDIREVDVVSDGESVRLDLLVGDIGSGRAYCPTGQKVERVFLEREAGLLSACDPAQPLLCARLGPSFRFTAQSDGFVCGMILLPDGAASDGCLGTVELVGSSVAWTIPLHGSFVTPEGDTRAYDARGTTVRLDASTYGDYGFWVDDLAYVSLLAMSDSIDETQLVTL